MVIRHLRQTEASKPVDLDYFSLTLLSSRDGKFDDTQRPIWLSAPFVEDSMSIDWDYFSLHFVSRRQVSPLTRKDEYGRLPPLVEDSMLFDLYSYSLPFTIQRQTSPIACGDCNGHSLLLFWGYQSPLSHPETNKSDGMRGQWWLSISNSFLKLL